MSDKPIYEERIQKVHNLDDQINQNFKNTGSGQVCTDGFKDITDHQLVGEDLRASREMLQLVMDNIPQFIFWKNRNSIYLGCNQEFCTGSRYRAPRGNKGQN